MLGRHAAARAPVSIACLVRLLIPSAMMLPVQVAVAEEQKKGSDSAINNGGKRPGLVGASPTPEDIEMTERELEAEDEEAAIEERWGPAL